VIFSWQKRFEMTDSTKENDVYISDSDFGKVNFTKAMDACNSFFERARPATAERRTGRTAYEALEQTRKAFADGYRTLREASDVVAAATPANPPSGPPPHGYRLPKILSRMFERYCVK
jgi:hypothetical protein